MAEYIEREALIGKLKGKIINPQTAFINNVLIGLLENAPAADVVEVRRGEWVHNKNAVVLNGFVCSICGHRESSLYPINAVIGGGYIADEHGNFFYPPKMNYCPNCGAKMDGKDGADNG